MYEKSRLGRLAARVPLPWDTRSRSRSRPAPTGACRCRRTRVDLVLCILAHFPPMPAPRRGDHRHPAARDRPPAAHGGGAQDASSVAEALFAHGACWHASAFNLRMMSGIASEKDRCRVRYSHVAAALQACAQMRGTCGGVSQDKGLVCGGSRFAYELRSSRTFGRSVHAGVRSWYFVARQKAMRYPNNETDCYRLGRQVVAALLQQESRSRAPISSRVIAAANKSTRCSTQPADD